MFNASMIELGLLGLLVSFSYSLSPCCVNPLPPQDLAPAMRWVGSCFMLSHVL